ncbi:HlyD family secretion protein [Tenacibaculum dicentrarchi]|nr:HlyD family secretion protein [Tenacibaculum dicentrarchi]MCD8420468.1 HlyD family secretion protein [Tenacibaculum dicentrarchi]MCD8436844.1 HlyD family secretion protein [Tenacibaculum dicentrarchi]MCD8450628.1 HlyD family secretion protein [Tenacibaculum dicentrarchi]MCG8828274.1 HlyD family efflux transporter periplasmic adaptor subunit [Tenacibaculum dicentrarchi]
MKQIFPKEIIENSVEVHQFKHSKKSKIVYNVILVAILLALISLPFIKITIYNTSQGLIRSDKERMTIQSSSSGNVFFHQLKNNLKVQKGDTLLIVSNVAMNHKIENTASQLNETKIFIEDLKLLASPKKRKIKLQSLKYQQEYSFYQQKLSEFNTRFFKIKQDYQRNQKLFKKGVIAKVTLNDSKLLYDLALNATTQHKKQQFSTWQNQLVNSQNQLKELENNQIQLKESSNLSIIKAPITGTLLNVKGIEKGSFIPNGLQLADISPQSDLIVECYINPTDIGLLKKGNKVKFQVTAFNYNQWGLATGSITAIGNDVEMVNNTPMFKVLCSLNQDFLQLKNGFKGHLKKGMFANARFELTERTLFDLLYDKMDDWLNPIT